jgi:hypothetical protein
MEAQQAATAAALSGPDDVPKSCELSIALSVLGSKSGSLSQRFAMLSAARKDWPDDPAGVLALMLLEDVVLGPGEAAIIPAGCPHAYVCGECCCCTGALEYAAAAIILSSQIPKHHNSPNACTQHPVTFRTMAFLGVLRSAFRMDYCHAAEAYQTNAAAVCFQACVLIWVEDVPTVLLSCRRDS